MLFLSCPNQAQFFLSSLSFWIKKCLTSNARNLIFSDVGVAYACPRWTSFSPLPAPVSGEISFVGLQPLPRDAGGEVRAELEKHDLPARSNSFSGPDLAGLVMCRPSLRANTAWASAAHCFYGAGKEHAVSRVKQLHGRKRCHPRTPNLSLVVAFFFFFNYE